MRVFILFLFLTLIYAASSVLNAESMYIKSLKANIMEKPDLASNIIKTVQRGEVVDIVGEQGMWRLINYKSSKGWLPFMLLCSQKPKTKISILDSDRDISGNARKRASTFTSAAAARGLYESGRRRITSMQLPDYNTLEMMEKDSVEESKALMFISYSEVK